MPIIFEFWDYRTSGDHISLGSVSLSINKILADPKGTFYNLKDKKGKDAGKFKFELCEFIEKPSFMEYIMGGT